MTTRTRSHISLVGRYVLCATLFAALAGCGGGGSASSAGASGATNAYSPPAGSSVTIGGTPATQVQVGQAYSFTPTASDPSGGALSYSIENKPSWATFSIATGELSGTPTSAGTYSNIIVSVSDGTGSASLPSFSIDVTSPATTGTATLTWTIPTTNTNGSTVTDLAGYYVHYGTSANDLSNIVQVASAATTSYTVTNLTAGTWYFGVAAYASDGTQSALSNIGSKTIQ